MRIACLRNAALFGAALLLTMIMPAMAGEHKEGEHKAPKIGDAAPDFELKDTKGEVHKLSEHKDQTVVLTWTNPDCPYIQRHYEEGTYQKLAKEFGSEDVVFLFIDSTHYMTPEKSDKFAKEHNSEIVTLLDPTGKTARKYGSMASPHTIIVDPKGKIVYSGAIDDDPPGNKAVGERENYVREALVALQAGQPIAKPSTKAYGCTIGYPPSDKEKEKS